MGLKKALASLSLAFAMAASPALPDIEPDAEHAQAGTNERSLSFYNTHTGEILRTVYHKNGRYIPSALSDINGVLRDHRQNKAIQMDTELIDLLHDIEQELNRRYPGRDIVFHVISGYRSPETNEMLRRTRGGQATNSRHLHGDAIDIRVPGIPTSEIRDIAWCLQEGGVGYYRSSDFVHVDTARVRFWNWTPRPGMCR